MDSYEFNIKIEHIRKLYGQGDLKAASEIADTINWRRSRNVKTLCMVGEIYQKLRRYRDCREVLQQAYEHAKVGRTVLSKLVEVSIEMRDWVGAEAWYGEYAEIAPDDILKDILYYKVNRGKGAEPEVLIDLLLAIKKKDYLEEWAYELACAYHRAGRIEECVSECDEIFIYFGDGDYVEKALRLKQLHIPLSGEQEKCLGQMGAMQAVSENLEKEAKGAAKGNRKAGEQPQENRKVSQERPQRAQGSLGQQEEPQRVRESLGQREDPQRAQGNLGQQEDPQRAQGSMGQQEDPQRAQGSMGQQEDPQRAQGSMGQRENPQRAQGSMGQQEDPQRNQAGHAARRQPEKIAPDDARASRQSASVDQRLQAVVPMAKEEIEITPVSYSVGRYNTHNLQEEIAKSIRNILNATEKEAVEDTISDIKRIVAMTNINVEIPEEFCQKPQQEPDPEGEEPDGGYVDINFDELLGEGGDGQIKLYIPQDSPEEKQITGQMTIQEILEEWEKAKEDAKKEEHKKSLENAKHEALRITKDLMKQLKSLPEILEEQGNLEGEVYNTRGYEPINIEENGQYTREGMPEEQHVAHQEDFKELENNARTAMPQGEAYGLSEEPEELEDPYMANQVDYGIPEGPEELEEPYMANQVDYEDQGDVPKAAVPQEDGDIYGIPEEPEGQYIAGVPFTDSPEAKTPEELQPPPKSSLRELATSPREEMRPEPKQRAEGYDARQKGSREAAPLGDVDVYGVPVEKSLPLNELTDEQRELFTFFPAIRGMEEQIAKTINNIKLLTRKENTSVRGNILISGFRGSGKTELAKSLVKAVQKAKLRRSGKIGKVTGDSLNTKNVASAIEKIQGGYLIIERAGEMTDETIQELSYLMEQDTKGMIVILEDESAPLRAILKRNPGFTEKFTEIIKIPVMTNDELVEFARLYAGQSDYTIDDMGILALYNRIGNIQRDETPTTLREVKEIVDEAIERAEKLDVKRVFDMVFAKKNMVLREKDFE